MPRHLSFILIIVLLILAALAYWVYSVSLRPARHTSQYRPITDWTVETENLLENQQNQPKNPIVQIDPDVTYFTTEGPLFVVRGRNLAKAEVWATLSDAGEDTGTNILMGNATRQSAAGYDERWVLVIPPGPVSVSKIFTKGFDAKGREVGEATLSAVETEKVYGNG